MRVRVPGRRTGLGSRPARRFGSRSNRRGPNRTIWELMPTPDNATFSSSPVTRPSTKIVATIGPASEDRLVQLIEAGLAVARINFSHGVEEDHRRRVEKVRTAARFTGVPIGILADIQGPKMRLGQLAAGERRLDRGQEVLLFEGTQSEDPDRLPFNFPGFRGALKPGDRVMLADGAVELVTQAVEGEDVRASVRRPGLISDRKGVHLPDSYLSQELPTPQDRKHIELAQDLGVDFLASRSCRVARTSSASATSRRR